MKQRITKKNYKPIKIDKKYEKYEYYMLDGNFLLHIMFLHRFSDEF
jgi:hypothetical protein